MNKQNFLRIPTTLLLAIAIVVAVVGTFLAITHKVTAQDAPPTSHTIGSGITYQGELNKDGVPHTGNCDMKFQLYGASSGGNATSSELAQSVAVSNGIFTVNLDFGSSNFTGNARYLNIAVKCAGDTDFTNMGSRVELTAVPYALTLRPGAEISGENHTTFSVTTSSTIHNASSIYGYSSAVSTLSDTYGVWGEINDSSSRGAGVLGQAGDIGFRPGLQSGVLGISNDGYGVSGMSSQASGVYGSTNGTSGAAGVYGRADNFHASGVEGNSWSTIGYGVQGTARANSGVNYGVYGATNSPDGYGVYSEGDTHIDGDLTWKPATSYLSIPAVAMQPNDESIEWDFSTGGEALYNPVSEYFVAPVFLPHNATVTEIKTWWVDGSANNATLSLRRIEPGVTWSDMVAVSSEGASGYISENSKTTIANPVIDNSQYSYLLYLTLPDADFSYFQTVIEYTTTSPN